MQIIFYNFINSDKMLEVGVKNKVEKIVGKSDTASHYGSGLLEVFATPAMIALMEQSAHLLAKMYLPDNEDTVGIEVSIKHIKATPIGASVYSEAELINIDGKKLTFKVTAFDQSGEIGNGTHIRYIINPSKFMDKLS